jgi:glycosyltransferase involved in cell wall biosynthesis
MEFVREKKDGRVHLLISGHVFSQQSFGGISRVFKEVLPLMCDLDKRLHVSLLLSTAMSKDLLSHEQICFLPGLFVSDAIGLRPSFLKRCLDRLQRLFILMTWDTRIPTIWFASYYRSPIRRKGPVVIFVADIIHELYPEIFSGRGNARFRARKSRAIRSADMIVCISETTKQDLIRHYHLTSSQIIVAPLAVSQTFHPLNNSDIRNIAPTQKPFLLYVGTRATYKNFDFFIKTYASWRGRGEIDVVVVGPAWSAYEKAILDHNGIADSVHLLLSGLDDKELCQLYNRAYALVYPSLYEGFGLPLLEAMASGCPVVASDIPSTREVAGDVPILFTSGDEASLHRAFDDLRNQDMVEERRKEGMKHASRYSWERTAAQMLIAIRQAQREWESRHSKIKTNSFEDR